MIEREECRDTQTVLVVKRITCDVCGKEQHGQRSGQRVVHCGQFYRRERNTPENVIEKHAFFNEWVLSKVADLCDGCASDVEKILTELAEKRGGTGPRRPDDYGD